MADDDGTGTSPPADPPHPTIDKDIVLAWIREVLDEDAPGTDVDPEDETDTEKVRYTAAEAEEIAEQAVRKAMKALAAAKPKRPPQASRSGDDGGKGSDDGTKKGEPSPTPPPATGRDLQARLRKFLVGAD